jgi:hypothetical protein
MKSLPRFALILTLLCLTSSITLSQKRRQAAPTRIAQATSTEEIKPAPTLEKDDTTQTTICKGQHTPDGYVTAGETSTSDCPNGAWILKKRGTRLRADAPQPTYPPQVEPSSRGNSDDEKEEEEDSLRKTSLSEATQFAGSEAVRALRRMNSVTRVGVNLSAYRAELVTLKDALDDAYPRIRSVALKDEIRAAYSEYMFAVDMWNLMVRNGFDWILAEGNGPGNQLMMKYGIQPIRDRGGNRILSKQLVMGAIWARATRHVQDAFALLNR